MSTTSEPIHDNAESSKTGLDNNGFEDNDFKSSRTQNRDFRSSISSLPFSKSTDRITYTWKNINVWTPGTDRKDKDIESGGYFKKKGKESKHILKDITGAVRPGELLAIMGASGAGKSTMLNILNFRNTGNLKITGERAVNGVPVGPDSLTSVSAYIQQDDLFIGSLTVREHLVFQALLRMHKHIPYNTRLQRVEEVIQELGLSKCAETQIGSPGRVKGISGGEMKRLSFASEILTDPPLMFCDEPTSGLDSYMSQNVISVLQNLTTQGKTIVCTIHQPSSEIFEMFHQILLMAEGRVAFMGKREKAIGFFKANGYPCPDNYNPSDFYIQTLAILPGNEVECRSRVGTICDSYENSERARKLKTAADRIADPNAAAYLASEATEKFKSPYKATWSSQFRAVLWRSWLSNLKDPVFIRMKFFQNLGLALIAGVVFFGQDFNQDGVQNINGVIFNTLMNLSFSNAFSTIDVFCLELPIFLREHFNGMYRTDVYFLAKILADSPVYIFFPSMMTAIIYFMIGLQPDAASFFITTGVYILATNCAVSIGYLISCVVPSVSAGVALAPVLIIPLVLFGGLFLNVGSIPIYLIWGKYISWFYYGSEAIAITQWKNVDYIDCNREDSTCPENGSVVLKMLDFREENIGIDILGLVSIIIGFRLLAYLALLAKTYRKRN